MNCLELRRVLGAEPGLRTVEIEAHLADCATCGAHGAEVARFERLLLRALEVPVPPVRVARAASRPRWLALAASVVGAAVVVAGLWSFYPREALASAIVGHMPHELGAWAKTQPLPASAVGYVLGRAGVALGEDAPTVTYAQSCWFRGWHVPHLVVQTDAGPMTVLLLRHEHVTARQSFDEDGYRGVIVPAGGGSFAVLSRSPGGATDVDAVAERVGRAVRFID